MAACERRLLFGRDKNLCANCGLVYRVSDITADHLTPESRGRPWSWTNLVAACRACNNRNDDRTPEEARMPLLYLPYEPNRFEAFILESRRILTDQIEFLPNGVPAHYRPRYARADRVVGSSDLTIDNN